MSANFGAFPKCKDMEWPYVGGVCVFKTFLTFIKSVEGKTREMLFKKGRCYLIVGIQSLLHCPYPGGIISLVFTQNKRNSLLKICGLLHTLFRNLLIP